MNPLAELILKHYKCYPLMQIQDVVKLIYQNEFAGGHLITNTKNAYEYLYNEYKNITTTCRERFEEIGNNVCRVNLADIEKEGIKLDTLNRFFVYTSNSRQGTIAGFEEKLNLFTQLCTQHLLPFDLQEVLAYIEKYKSEGYPPVSHSEIYRQNYDPHYRIVDIRFKYYFKLFCQIDTLMRDNKITTIAIDGNSGSGKSSLARIIDDIYDCNVFHMDDFFLSPSEKTKERLNEVGGNVDYVRFKEQVMIPLVQGKTFKYQIFDCKQGKLTDWIDITTKPLNIIEGVYSLHPHYASYYDLKVFLHTDDTTQLERILHRNGAYMLERFKKEWIPLENNYFSALNIKSSCDYVIDTSFH